jgi:hypothetical protein
MKSTALLIMALLLTVLTFKQGIIDTYAQANKAQTTNRLDCK